MRFNLLLILIILVTGAVPLSVSAQAPDPEEPPTVEIIRQWASSAEATSSYAAAGSDDWAAIQATGAANTPICEDLATAWTSQTPNGVDSLTLLFDEPVIPTQVNIYQSYGVGSITSVSLIAARGGKELPIEDSADPRTVCPAYFSLSLAPNAFPEVNGVIIYIDQTTLNTFNAIDAVELVGIEAELAASLAEVELGVAHQWATTATATSQYSDDNWSAAQATGSPNTYGCGDQITAWASATSTGQDQLTLNYDIPVIPLQIHTHQTYNPGAITEVALIETGTNAIISVSNSANNMETPCPGIFIVTLLDIETTPVIQGVVISLDQTITGNWNEIDAVEVIGIISTSE